MKTILYYLSKKKDHVNFYLPPEITYEPIHFIHKCKQTRLYYLSNGKRIKNFH